MSDKQYKARLKHAAEVLGWLAEGKELDWKDDGRWAPVTPGLSPAARVDYIIGTGEVYRIKPEPVVYESTVSHLATQLVIFAECGLQFGDKVRVTKIED